METPNTSYSKFRKKKTTIKNTILELDNSSSPKCPRMQGSPENIPKTAATLSKGGL